MLTLLGRFQKKKGKSLEEWENIGGSKKNMGKIGKALGFTHDLKINIRVFFLSFGVLSKPNMFSSFLCWRMWISAYALKP